MAAPIRIPEKILAWREHQRKGKIMRPKTFRKIKGRARRTGYRYPSAVGGKAYWITLLRKYLDVHPGDRTAIATLKKLTQRRYKAKPKRKRISRNPRTKWYVGIAKDTGALHRFKSIIEPTRKTHGRLYKFITGPFPSEQKALDWQRHSRA